jgi:hypothetical protein
MISEVDKASLNEPRIDQLHLQSAVCLCRVRFFKNFFREKIIRKKNKLRGPQSASEVYRLSDRHLSTKFSANFCIEGCRVVSAADPLTVVNLSFLDRSLYFSFK